MAMHMWGSDFDWKALNEAGDLVRKELLRFKVPVRDIKEKFGELRVYCSFGLYRGWLFNHLFYPDHLYYRGPRWLQKLDYAIPVDYLNFIFVPLHQWAYRRAYRLAVQKYPHIKDEILDAADWPEYLEGLK